MILGFW